MQRSALSLCASAITAACLLWTPGEAEACGGTFCDGGNPMPVDQTGEDILFIRDGDQMEVHVRIQYTGGPERFAWMVPLPAVPDVSVGTEALFIQLGAATIPSWTTTRTFEDPSDAPPPSGTTGVFTPDDPDAGPDIVFEDTVGAFEVVVLQAASAAEVLEFFDANNYSFEPAAAPIIQQYIDEGFLITGVKLTTAASVDSIHPLVFRFTSDEPCVPIRLTAVAADSNMGVRAYFLGQERWAPTNYAHVELNPAAYNWANPGLPAYIELLSLAVDEAGGRAFATDYSGSSDVVTTSTIWQPSWSAPDWASLTATEAVGQLLSLGLLWFNSVSPQLRLILREYIPPPPDWTDSEEEYWLTADLSEVPAWDGPAFAADFDELVVEPGMHAVDMLEAWPTLTRLHTTLSAHEMTVDPIFHPAPDLPAVANSRNANAHVFTGFEWTRYLLPFEVDPDGMTARDTRVCVAEDGNWPGFPGLDDMPRALRIEQAPMMGPLQVVTDNEAEILALITAHNEGSPCDDSPDDPPGGDTGETGGDDAGANEARGCQVAPVGAGGALGVGLGLLALFGLRRRAARAVPR